MAPIWNATFPATPNLAAQALIDVLSTFMELAIGLAIVGGIAAMTILLCGTVSDDGRYGPGQWSRPVDPERKQRQEVMARSRTIVNSPSQNT